MLSLKKLIICPFFGDMPNWMDKFIENYETTLKPSGYDLLIDTDLEGFKERVRKKLLIEYPGLPGTGKVWDMRCALGLLYWDELVEYDYFGHCDFDVVFGNVNAFIPDSELAKLDVYSSHDTYVCGAFSLYKNSIPVKYLFMRHPQWREFMIYPEPNAWLENQYARVLEQSGLTYKYDLSIQGNPFLNDPVLEMRGNDLFQKTDDAWNEVGFFHFRRSKHKGWPI